MVHKNYREQLMGLIPNIWEIIDLFKKRCKIIGWDTHEQADLVTIGDKCHNFLWIRELHTPTFKSVVKNNKFAIQEGTAYRMVNVSYTAWICLKTPPVSLVYMITENPELLKQNAIYDLSKTEINGTCQKINETTSEVFIEFERFLEEKSGIKIKPAQLPLKV